MDSSTPVTSTSTPTVIEGARNSSRGMPNKAGTSGGSRCSSKYSPRIVLDSLSRGFGTGTVFSGYSVLTKGMLGVGMLSMANICAEYGLVLGMVALGFCGLLSWFSLYILGVMAVEHKGRPLTFFTVSDAIDPRVSRILDISLFIHCFGSSVAYIQVAGGSLFKSLNAIAPNSFPETNEGMITKLAQVITTVVLFAPCCFREVTHTVSLNAFGLLALGVVTIIGIVQSVADQHADPSPVALSTLLWPTSAAGVMWKFSSFFFAYACHENIFAVAEELDGRLTYRSVNFITFGTALSGFVIYLPLLVVPFLAYGRDVSAPFLANLSPTPWVHLARLLTYISVSINFVLIIHALRRSLLSLYYKTEFPADSFEFKARVFTSLIAAAASLGISVLPINLEDVIAVTGLLGCNTMGFCIPSYLYIRKYIGGFKQLFERHAKTGVRPITKLNNFAACLLFVTSVALYPIGIFGIFASKLGWN